MILDDDSNSMQGEQEKFRHKQDQLAFTRLRPYFWLLLHSTRFVYSRTAPILEVVSLARLSHEAESLTNETFLEAAIGL